MLVQAPPRMRFHLDEERAAAWLKEAVGYTEWNMSQEVVEAAEERNDLPWIHAEWSPRTDFEDSTVCDLVRLAAERGILAEPDETELHYELVDDSDGGYYHFIVRVGRRLKLATYAEERRRLGDPEATGADAALAVLREAEHKANSALGELDDYAVARRMARPLSVLRAEWDQLPPASGPEEATAARSRLERELAAEILDAPPQARVGRLFVVVAGWSARRAELTSAEPGSPEWFADLGPREHATLTGDGRDAVPGSRCECAAPELVPYEEWTAGGRQASGHVCGQCRQLAGPE